MSPAERETASGFCLHLSGPLDRLSPMADRLADPESPYPPALSLHETSDPDIWTLEAFFEKKPDMAETKRLLSAFSPLPAMKLTPLPERNWVSVVQSGLSPVYAGRFFIHGSHDRRRAHPASGHIEIDAGEAFGTAHHGTTKGCLLALDILFKKYPAGRFRKVLDLGTGSGLLAIAAARLLHRLVVASDIDPVSVRVATHNASLNRVAPMLKIVRANGLSHPLLRRNAPYDLLMANILAPPLLELAPDIRKSLAPGAMLVLSGLLQAQSRRIEARYYRQGFSLAKRLPLDEWMTLILKAP